jgi:O-antigen ligase
MQSQNLAKRPVTNRILFFLLCFYWLSQAFLVPLAPIGPSWALWPSLSDLAVLAMLPILLYCFSKRVCDRDVRVVLKLEWEALFLCSASFALATAFYGSRNEHVTTGIYQLARSVEYLAVLLVAAQTAIAATQWKVLRWVMLLTFFLISGGLLVIATHLITPSVVSPLLPLAPALAGPWGAYANGEIKDGGFISYNHAYIGMQLILSGGATYFCFERSRRVRLLICLLLLLCTFYSFSRASFIVASVLVLALEWRREKSNLLALAVLCSLGGAWAIQSLAVEDVVERQSSSASSVDEDGMSGRTTIWQDHLDYFTSHPINLIVGTGYGYAGWVSPANAHNLYLHVTTEAGLVGLIFFLYLQRRTLLLLRGHKLRTMRLTVLALLVSGLTQETFYPVVSFSHFLGFYLSVLAITLRSANSSEGGLSDSSFVSKPVLSRRDREVAT